MSIEQLANIAEVIGLFVVGITLIFLVIQLRQNTKAIKAASSREFVEMYNTFTNQLVMSVDLGSIWVRGLRDFESLPHEETVRFSALAGQLMRVYESAHDLRLDGFMEDDFYQAFFESLRDSASSTGFRQWWKTRSHWYSPDFRQVVDEFIENPSGRTIYTKL